MELKPIIIVSSSFLTFVPMYNQALDIQIGEPEANLWSLIHKQNLFREENTLVVEFQIKLLTLTVSDSRIQWV